MSANRARKPVRKRDVPDRDVTVPITKRDRKIITVVALHGAVSGRQLMDLGFFTSRSRANRRLRRLYDAGFLRRTYLASGAYGTEAIYLLGRGGCSIVTEEAALDYVELTRQSRRTPARMFLEHHLAVMEVRLAAQKDAARQQADIEVYLAEIECRHEYTVGASRRIIKPDGLLLVRQDNQKLALFLEVDRGCVSLVQMAKTFGRYQSYLTDGAFRDCYEEDSFEVLVITTAGQRRIAHLEALTKSNRSPLIRFTTLDNVLSHGFFGPIWQRRGADVLEPLMACGPIEGVRHENL